MISLDSPWRATTCRFCGLPHVFASYERIKGGLAAGIAIFRRMDGISG